MGDFWKILNIEEMEQLVHVLIISHRFAFIQHKEKKKKNQFLLPFSNNNITNLLSNYILLSCST